MILQDKPSREKQYRFFQSALPGQPTSNIPVKFTKILRWIYTFQFWTILIAIFFFFFSKLQNNIFYIVCLQVSKEVNRDKVWWCCSLSQCLPCPYVSDQSHECEEIFVKGARLREILGLFLLYVIAAGLNQSKQKKNKLFFFIHFFAIIILCGPCLNAGKKENF